MSVKAPKRRKVGRPELSISGRPREPRTASGNTGSPSYSCPRRCAWRRTLGCVRPSSSVRAPARAAPKEGVCVTSTVEAVAHCLLPEEAGTGATPHKRAKDASLLSLSGLSPTATSREAAVSVPTPRSATRTGTASDTNRPICSCSWAISAERATGDHEQRSSSPTWSRPAGP